MVDYDFSKTFLSRKNIAILKKSNKDKTLKYNPKYDELLKNGFLEYCEYESDNVANQIPNKELIQISEKGIAFLAYIKRIISDFIFQLLFRLSH